MEKPIALAIDPELLRRARTCIRALLRAVDGHADVDSLVPAAYHMLAELAAAGLDVERDAR